MALSPANHGRAGLALALTLAACATGCGSCSPSPTATAPSAAALSPSGPTPTISVALQATLLDALRAKGPTYKPRTKHLLPDGAPKYTNRLIVETSPYLLQHAHNPVSWFPWGDEAFALAKATKRPVFLSIGYSTCHWCHVMEEESFEDEEIASYLNDNYIPIKVDREERPDVDAIYMTAVQAYTGSGGWPMSSWLTPERQPFFAGTYFPPREGVRGARRGFLTLLKEQALRFKQAPGTVAEEAQRLTNVVRQNLASNAAGGLPGYGVIAQVASLSVQRFDPTHGGARRAPKFPSSFPIRVLLRHQLRAGDPGSLNIATQTLQKMAAGGIYDHVGGGFHRYATDVRWLVPHFEKMLYDNALLAVAYLEGFQATGDQDFARTARETLDYVIREMTSPEGGFYSATDADSLTPSGHREEGWFFTWTPAEIQGALGAERARVVERYYAVTPAGNFEGRNILNAPRARDEVARDLRIERTELDSTLEAARAVLRDVREKKPPPLRDDKIQTSWNGLMISAMAQGAMALNEPRYERAAIRAADMVLSALRPGGTLKHSWLAGKTGADAFLDDFTFFAAGLLDLFEQTSDPRWLREAITLMDGLEKTHADAQQGGYFLTAERQETLLARQKPDNDGAVPSGNSIALMNHLRLGELTTEDRYRQRAETTLRAFAKDLEENPLGLSEMVLALDFKTDEAREIALIVPDGETRASAEPMLALLRRAFVPNRVLVVASEAALNGELGKLVPWAAGKPAKGQKPTAYVCKRGACDLPTVDPAVFARQIKPKAAEKR